MAMFGTIVPEVVQQLRIIHALGALVVKEFLLMMDLRPKRLHVLHVSKEHGIEHLLPTSGFCQTFGPEVLQHLCAEIINGGLLHCLQAIVIIRV